MAGGNWTVQNKVLPGVYTNYQATGAVPSTGSIRGVIGLPAQLPWLPDHTVIPVDAAYAAALAMMLGSDALLVTEAAKNASLIYLYRLNRGTQATATLGGLKCTALYGGAYGNRVSVSIEAVAGQSGSFDVITMVDQQEFDRQRVSTISDLTDNGVVSFSAEEGGQLAANAGTALTGGADGTVTNADYVQFLAAMETLTVNAIACTSAESDVKELFVSYGRRMIKEEGKYLQIVAADVTDADFEGVISVKNGVVLEDGTSIGNAQATAYIAGATAACPLNQSLTNAVYIGAVDVDERYTTSQQTELAKSGQMVFIPSGGNRVLIQKDINTLVNFTSAKTYAMSKNKIIRTLFDICTEIQTRGTSNYLGKVQNNQDGRELFRADILSYFRALETSGVIRDVSVEDITVFPGELLDAIKVDYTVRPVDTMDVIYGTITLDG